MDNSRHLKNVLYRKLTYFSDSALHDEEMWVVDIELDRSEKILDSVVLNIWSVDEILVFATNHNLEKAEFKIVDWLKVT